jgi:hypothetical protein
MTGLCLFVFSCQPSVPASWQKFMDCANTACVAEVVAVKDDYLKDPKPLYEEFIKTDERGEDHFVGWLYILRDSVLLNSNYGPTMVRFDLQQALINKSREFENDPKYGTWAKSVIGELEVLAIASELEDVPPMEGSVTGTYGFELPNDAGSGELKVLDNGDETIRFKLVVVGPPPAHNQGYLDGTAQLMGNTATITTTDFGGKCVIELSFGADEVVAKTVTGGSAECGFGNRVMADGTYKLVDDLDPFRGEGGDEVPANILGSWVSNDDPKSEIKLADGEYADIYDGKEVAKNPFSYHKSCPEDCGPAGKEPCIKTVGQDDMCYAVIFADGKTLQLSVITGRGNTLSFKRKK